MIDQNLLIDLKVERIFRSMAGLTVNQIITNHIIKLNNGDQKIDRFQVNTNYP